MPGRMQRLHPAEYRAWSGMRCRCNNPSVANYADYGGRGITVCERWSSFRNFLADMGHKPTALHSIDRVNNDGNYEPGNCEWATREQQNNNQRGQIKVIFNGYAMTIAQAHRAAKSPVPIAAVRSRLRKGWNLDRALHTPKITGEELRRRQTGRPTSQGVSQ